jgi:outer membrane protein OmpA-like peptidoglycan-associated protein
LPPTVSDVSVAGAGAVGTAASRGLFDDITHKYILYFSTDNMYDAAATALADNNEQVLADLLALLKAHGEYRLRVIGHVNPLNPTPVEERTVLQPLSLKRAEAVARTLAERGVGRSRMIVSGVGGQYPVVGVKDRDLWHLNRRVECTIIK